MCLMIRRSRIALQKSKEAVMLYESGNDELWLDSACFDAQQAIEFLMKGILEQYGKVFGPNDLDIKKGHSISYILEQLDDTGFLFEEHDALEQISFVLTDWEQKGRYGTGLHTSVSTLRKIYRIYDSIFAAFLQMQEDNQERKSFTTTYENDAAVNKTKETQHYLHS